MTIFFGTRTTSKPHDICHYQRTRLAFVSKSDIMLFMGMFVLVPFQWRNESLCFSYKNNDVLL